MIIVIPLLVARAWLAEPLRARCASVPDGLQTGFGRAEL